MTSLQRRNFEGMLRVITVRRKVLSILKPVFSNEWYEIMLE